MHGPDPFAGLTELERLILHTRAREAVRLAAERMSKEGKQTLLTHEEVKLLHAFRAFKKQCQGVETFQFETTGMDEDEV